jgi:hypothetical protein
MSSINIITTLGFSALAAQVRKKVRRIFANLDFMGFL